MKKGLLNPHKLGILLNVLEKESQVLLTYVSQEGDSRCQRRDPVDWVTPAQFEKDKVEKERAGAFHKGSMVQRRADGGAALRRYQVLDEVEMRQLPRPVELGDSPARPHARSLGQQLGSSCGEVGLEEQELLERDGRVGGCSIKGGTMKSEEEEEQSQDHVWAKATTPRADLQQHPQLKAARAQLQRASKFSGQAAVRSRRQKPLGKPPESLAHPDNQEKKSNGDIQASHSKGHAEG